MKTELQSLSEEQFDRLVELCKSGAPCDFKEKEQLKEFMKKVKGETQ